MKRIVVLVTILLAAAFGQTTTSVKEHCDAVLYAPDVIERADTMSAKERSDLELCRPSHSLEVEGRIIDSPHAIDKGFGTKEDWKMFREQSRTMWYDLREVYCQFNTEASYIDPLGNLGKCPKADSLLLAITKGMTKERLDKLFESSLVLDNNVDTFSLALAQHNLEMMQQNPPQRLNDSKNNREQPQLPAPPVAEVAAISNQQASTTSANVKPSQVAAEAPIACDKNISFAVAEAGQIVSRVPAFADKWISKNQKKYAGLCFSQVPNSKAANYLLVFSTSQSAFNGIYPTVRTSTNTSTSTTPVSGSGTVTDNYGGMWNYTYDGAITTTTTTTTTTQQNLPYTDTSNTLYLRSYDQHGRVISERWRTITTRQGGDGANTLGYNLGAALGAIHMRQHLLKNVVEDVTKGQK